MKKLLLSSVLACAAFAQAPLPQAVGGALQQSTLDTINYLVSHQGGGGLPTGCTSPGTGAITCTGTVLAGAFGTGTSITILSTPALCAAVTTPAANTIALFRDSAASNVLSMKISAGTCSAIGSTSTNGTSTQLLTSDGVGGYGTAVSQLAVVPQVFYPESYGALRDDSHDDTTAIQAAVTAASAVHGTVRLQAGVYKTTAAISVPNYTNIEGVSNIYSVIMQHTSTADGLTVTGTGANCSGGAVGYLSFKNFQVSRPATSSTNNGISLVDSCYVSLFQVYSFNSKNDLYLSGAGNTHVTSGYFGWTDGTTAVRNGIFLDSSVDSNNSTVIDGHTVSNGGSTGGTGILAQGACVADLFVYGFETATMDYGVHINSTAATTTGLNTCNSDLHLSKLILDTIQVVGVWVQGVRGGGVPGVELNDSHFQGVNGSVGALIDNSYMTSISGSQFHVHGTGSANIRTDGVTHGPVLGANIVGNTFEIGEIDIDATDQTYSLNITANQFFASAANPTVTAIKFSGTSGYSNVLGNMISGYDAAAIGTGIDLGVGTAATMVAGNTIVGGQVTALITDAGTGNNVGVTASGATSCTIKAIFQGIVTSATCI